ncbi:hypothetical protein [Snuella sedimenti]|nr:hypothetical protein [Snuella sedimenti]
MELLLYFFPSQEWTRGQKPEVEGLGSYVFKVLLFVIPVIV